MPVACKNISITPANLERLESFRECLDSVARERKWLMHLQAHSLSECREYWGSVIAADEPAFFANDGERVVGWIDIKPYPEEGIRHRGRLGMGVLDGYRGQRIGRRLMEAALTKAKQSGLVRVDLTVYATNTAAIMLYQKFGFVEEGRMIKGRYLDGQYDDILYMGLIFPENVPSGK